MPGSNIQAIGEAATMNYGKRFVVQPGDEGSTEQDRPRVHGQAHESHEHGGAEDPEARRAHGQAAVSALRGRQAVAADRPAGARRRRQGRRDPPRVRRDEPAGDVGRSASSSRARRRPRTISSGGSTGARRARARSRSSIARITRTCWWCASTSWCRSRSGRSATS